MCEAFGSRTISSSRLASRSRLTLPSEKLIHVLDEQLSANLDAILFVNVVFQGFTRNRSIDFSEGNVRREREASRELDIVLEQNASHIHHLLINTLGKENTSRENEWILIRTGTELDEFLDANREFIRV